MTSEFTHAVALAAAGITLAMPVTGIMAGTMDYECQPVAVDVKNGDGSELAVRLVNKTTG